jgi:hypothetical protein
MCPARYFSLRINVCVLNGSLSATEKCLDAIIGSVFAFYFHSLKQKLIETSQIFAG